MPYATPESPDNKAIRELRDSVKDLNDSTKTSNLIMIGLTFILVVFTAVLIWLPDYNQKTKFFQIDRYNFTLACYFTGFEQTGVPAWQYETQIYSENADFWSTFNKENQKILFKNIALMKMSNNMIDAGLNDPHNIELTQEVVRKIKPIAKEIMNNMKKYDEKLTATQCIN